MYFNLMLIYLFAYFYLITFIFFQFFNSIFLYLCILFRKFKRKFPTHNATERNRPKNTSCFLYVLHKFFGHADYITK